LKFSEFFRDPSGKLSMIRLQSFLCVLTGLFIAVITGIKVYYMQPVVIGTSVIPIDTGFVTALTFLIIGLVTAGMGIKTTQKWRESSPSGKEQELTNLPQQVGVNTDSEK
jgi:hypothetical protein